MSDAIPAGFEALSDATAASFEGHVGPMFRRMDVEAGHAVWGFRAELRHCNPYGMLHGGMAVTLADTMMGSLVFDAIGGAPCATISLNTEFMAAAKAGQWVEGRAELLRQGRNVCFVRGELFADEKRIMMASGAWAIIGGK
ncbi:MAG: PaaI family thioesterase [Parvibaculum sp.]